MRGHYRGPTAGEQPRSGCPPHGRQDALLSLRCNHSMAVTPAKAMQTPKLLNASEPGTRFLRMLPAKALGELGAVAVPKGTTTPADALEDGKNISPRSCAPRSRGKTLWRATAPGNRQGGNAPMRTQCSRRSRRRRCEGSGPTASRRRSKVLHTHTW